MFWCCCRILGHSNSYIFYKRAAFARGTIFFFFLRHLVQFTVRWAFDRLVPQGVQSSACKLLVPTDKDGVQFQLAF